MNTDTPESLTACYDDEHGEPCVPLAIAIKLERERDEARGQLAGIEDKMRVELGGHPNSELWGEAGLIAATMRCVDALGEVTDQRDRLLEEREQWRLSSVCRELIDQRDRLAADLRIIADGTSCRECGGEDQARLAREALQSLNTTETISK